MIAFVLSGGSTRGPLQVGALQALLESGLQPDFYVGTSTGALNSAYMAACGNDLACVEKLADIWRGADAKVIYPGSWLTLAWRVLSKADSLYSSDGLRAHIQASLPPGVTTFGDLKLPCYITAADLRSNTLFLFGEDPQAPLVEAVMASAALPAIYPPVAYHDLQLVDGGVLDNVPASIAMDKGATTIYVINVGYGGDRLPPARGVMQILTRSLNTMIAQSLLTDLERALESPTIELHHIHISAFSDVAFNDFSKTEEMLAAGREAAQAYLANPQPRAVRPMPSRGVEEVRSVAGARAYVPSYRH